MENVSNEPIFSLKLLAMALKSSWRHLAYNKNKKQNKNLDKMATKMAVRYKKYFPETVKLQEFACKMLILLILELQTSSL